MLTTIFTVATTGWINEAGLADTRHWIASVEAGKSSSLADCARRGRDI
jgi:hypothetical protein